MKAAAWLVAAATLAGTGGYLITYLVRWEWHRALVVGLLFLAVEVAVATALSLRAVHRATAAAAAQSRGGDPAGAQILEHIEATRPTRDHFAWLAPRDGTAVFIPVLLGAGVLVSAVAFVVERLAAGTVEPGMERGLARELGAVAFPQGGLVADDAELAAQELPFADDPELRVLLAPLRRGAARG